MSARARSRGFTAVELLVALAVFAVVASLAVPSFQTYVANQRLRTASFDLVSDLIVARSEALKRNADVTLAPAGESWEDGWEVATGGSDAALRSRAAPGRGIAVVTAPTAVTFDRSGYVADAEGVVRFGLAALEGGSERCIELDPSGRPHVERSACP